MMGNWTSRLDDSELDDAATPDTADAAVVVVEFVVEGLNGVRCAVQVPRNTALHALRGILCDRLDHPDMIGAAATIAAADDDEDYVFVVMGSIQITRKQERWITVGELLEQYPLQQQPLLQLQRTKTSRDNKRSAPAAEPSTGAEPFEPERSKQRARQKIETCADFATEKDGEIIDGKIVASTRSRITESSSSLMEQEQRMTPTTTIPVNACDGDTSTTDRSSGNSIDVSTASSHEFRDNASPSSEKCLQTSSGNGGGGDDLTDTDDDDDAPRSGEKRHSPECEDEDRKVAAKSHKRSRKSRVGVETGSVHDDEGSHHIKNITFAVKFDDGDFKIKQVELAKKTSDREDTPSTDNSRESLDLLDLHAQRCKTCVMCVKEDCGRCRACKSNADVSLPRRQACLMKVSLKRLAMSCIYMNISHLSLLFFYRDRCAY